MSFTTKNKKQNGMHFLDVQIIREDKTFTTSAYHCKLTFSGVYTHFDSFLPYTYKFFLNNCFKRFMNKRDYSNS